MRENTNQIIPNTETFHAVKKIVGNVLNIRCHVHFYNALFNANLDMALKLIYID